MSQNDDRNLVEIVEHLAARIEGYSMDLHRRIDFVESEMLDIRSRLEDLLEEIEDVIGDL